MDSLDKRTHRNHQVGSKLRMLDILGLVIKMDSREKAKLSLYLDLSGKRYDVSSLSDEALDSIELLYQKYRFN